MLLVLVTLLGTVAAFPPGVYIADSFSATHNTRAQFV